MDALISRCSLVRKAFAVAALAACTVSPLFATTPWTPFGPDGGDARRIAVDSQDAKHLFLGSANGWIYESHDEGASWRRVAQIGKRDDLVLDSIVVDAKDPKHLVVGAFALGSVDGGIFLSNDSGATWQLQDEMRGQSVRALTVSTLSPNVLVAGTLRGVFRSEDAGRHWKQISPADSVEIHNIQSVAIDPKNPNVIYAGTWHLPWKTVDGGAHWDSMKAGIIDDSDVFSIIVDPQRPEIVYASACSGIYKSEDAGTLFHKIQGIPTTARRTRKLLQDPGHSNVVFAGTTEGLWRSEDAGKVWARITGPEVIVNDVEVDPTDSMRVLIATDRGGVLSSTDGGTTFTAANAGFSARQVTAIARDRTRPESVYVGIVNDKEWGGVFESSDAGAHWMQHSDGLQGRDVFSLGQSPQGVMVAGTAHGLFRLAADTKHWTLVEGAPRDLAAERDKPAPAPAAPHAAPRTSATAKKKGAPVAHAVHGSTRPPGIAPAAPIFAGRPNSELHLAGSVPPPNKTSFDGSVYVLANAGDTMLAATSEGLLTSTDDGLTWSRPGVAGSPDWRFMAAAKTNVVAASLRTIQSSVDSGTTWSAVTMPPSLTQMTSVSVDAAGAIWVGGREGVFVTTDNGANWTTPRNLSLTVVTSLFFDATTNRMLVTAGGNDSYVFTVQLPGREVTYVNSGWSLRQARPVGDQLVGVTLFDGVVVQPKRIAQAAPLAARTSVTP